MLLIARLPVAALGCVLLLAGCGGKDRPATTPAATVTTAAAVAEGRAVFMRSGCLACHQLGSEGNSGPGNNLTNIGDRRSSAELREALVNAPMPMPSYDDVPRPILDDLVAYLAAQRAGEDCPDGSDCG